MEVDEEKPLAAQGQKRPPEDELTNEQRLTKRFHLLNIENARQLYIPTQTRSPTRRQRSNAVSDSMNLDDSKHHIYIHDLDEELASIESDEERLVFLPDVEKRLANLPKSVLTSETAPRGKEVVLYSVPESLSLPPEQDNVRKAILEARERAREMQANAMKGDMGLRNNESHVNRRSPSLTQGATFQSHGRKGEDAMDLD